MITYIFDTIYDLVIFTKCSLKVCKYLNQC